MRFCQRTSPRPGAVSRVRKIRFRVLFTATAALLAIVIPASRSGATTINFDDLNASSGDIILDTISPYQGLTWTNFSVYTSTPGFPGYNNGIVSAPNAAYGGGDNLGSPTPSYIVSPNDFDLVSAYLGSGWYDGLDLTVEGLLDGSMHDSKTVMVSTTGAQLFSFNFTGINSLEFFTTATASTTDPYGCGPSGCSQFTLDNLTITPSSGPPPPTVPEPATWAAFLLGIAAITALRRIRSQR